MPELDVVVQVSWDKTKFLAYTNYSLCGEGISISEARKSALNMVDAHLSWYKERKKDFPAEEEGGAFGMVFSKLFKGRTIVRGPSERVEIAGSYFNVNYYRLA